jgi:hypothetical protein
MDEMEMEKKAILFVILVFPIHVFAREGENNNNNNEVRRL